MVTSGPEGSTGSGFGQAIIDGCSTVVPGVDDDNVLTASVDDACGAPVAAEGCDVEVVPEEPVELVVIGTEVAELLVKSLGTTTGFNAVVPTTPVPSVEGAGPLDGTDVGSVGGVVGGTTGAANSDLRCAPHTSQDMLNMTHHNTTGSSTGLLTRLITQMLVGGDCNDNWITRYAATNAASSAAVGAIGIGGRAGTNSNSNCRLRMLANRAASSAGEGRSLTALVSSIPQLGAEAINALPSTVLQEPEEQLRPEIDMRSVTDCATVDGLQNSCTAPAELELATATCPELMASIRTAPPRNSTLLISATAL
ncbi:MAG: hypothetical protein Q8J97_03275, partial [Flavobacteriaceae bacterium]|nr:hypothetical protein [Flavobacteriaceae bacterium]